MTNQHIAGTGTIAARDRRNIREGWDISDQGMSFDACGYPVMALWMACFLQAHEATWGE